MIFPLRHKALRQASWLAIFAILLQAIVPPVHHLAMAGTAGRDGAHALCLAPGSVAPQNPGKAPARHIASCDVCAALTVAGGFVPHTATLTTVSRDYGVVVPSSRLIFLVRRWSHVRQQSRAPPVLI